MRFTKEKKEIILSYLLEKISEGKKDAPHLVSEEFGINLNTVHVYLSELIAQGRITRVKRGEYRLNDVRHEYAFTRSGGDLDGDMDIFLRVIDPLIRDYPEQVQRIWAYASSEMINNVMDHSEAENVYVTIIHNMRETSVIIQDDGVGIFHKLREHYGFKSFADIAAELSKGKLTTDEENHSGEGIFFTSRMMDRFFVYSEGHFYSGDKYENEWESYVPKGDMKGTLVFLSLENNSRRTAKEVFDQYTNEEGGFQKTEIRLASVFDKAPVSRSQAKRLCHRLEDFEEVVLDFSDISWAGQGFMHEVFVVFRKKNPQVSLTPINMLPDVAAMYRHVNA